MSSVLYYLFFCRFYYAEGGFPMSCYRMIVPGIKIILIAFLLFSGCNSNSSNDNNQNTVNNSEGISEGSTNLSGVTLSGVLGDVFFVRTLFKGPSNPGPDGTVGPPDDAGEGPPEDVDPNNSIGEEGGGPPDGTSGSPDGTTGPPAGTDGAPDDGSGSGPGRGGNGLGDFSQYSLVAVLEETELYGVPDLLGHFRIQHCPPGDHTLIILHYGEMVAKKYIRILEHDLDLKEITEINEDGFFICNGFDGYCYNWKDVNGDGINDHFMDVNGDGFCDFYGRAYVHGYGWQDENKDGINDNFIDADGDRRNDFFPQHYYGFFFGFIDLDNDGVNDFFQDRNGDGIDDLNNLDYIHGYGWQDEDGDGINDNFSDADGDGINDLTGRLVAHGYQFKFVDLDEDGINDNVTDADGDGICDHGKPWQGTPYAHGYGWRDEDGDGVNDNFTDADGDGANDLTGLAYSYGGNRAGSRGINEDGTEDEAND